MKPVLDEAVDYVQFQFTTVFGDLKVVEFPAKIWDEMCGGTGVDGSSLKFLRTEQSDMKVHPDFDTFAVLPWEPRVARFICDLWDNNDTPHVACPRSVLKKTVAKAKKLGYEYRTRPELEWYFVDEECNPMDRGLYMDTSPYDKLGYLRRMVTDDLADMGVELKTIHHEGGEGQQEIEFQATGALKVADHVQTAKLVAKAEAAMNDVVCTFMPKPFPEQPGSGMHIHQYLTKKGENVFADPEKGISDLLLHFVGGVFEHADAISAFLNPLTNSYKRLVPGHEAPVYKSWGVGNRTALVRIPGYEKSARVEYRAPDCSANIYIAEALLLAAGLDGVKRKIEPISPTIENVDEMTEDKRGELGITQLPTSLEESLNHLEGDDFVQGVLGREMVGIFLDVKRREYRDFLDAKAKGSEEEKRWELSKYLVRA